jgi:hypothetical protein
MQASHWLMRPNQNSLPCFLAPRTNPSVSLSSNKIKRKTETTKLLFSATPDIRGVLGNKCAGQHNLKTVHFREIFASGNFLAWFSGVCVFFYSTLSTLGQQRRVFM